MIFLAALSLNSASVSAEGTSLADNIYRALVLDPGVAVEDVKVIESNGKVELTGKVGSYAQKHRATIIASSFVGVKSIRNLLEVEGKKRSDADIKEDVAEALRYAGLLAKGKCEVNVRRGVVGLSGTVGSYMEMREALEIASQTAGVMDVEDELVIKSAEVREDADIARELETRLENHPQFGKGRIHGYVKDRNVVLKGSIFTLEEMKALEELAWVGGVEQVDLGRLRFKDPDYPEKFASSPPMDITIKRLLNQAYDAHPELSVYDPYVYVSNGVVKLQGHIGDLAAKYKAEEIAFTIIGVREVDNQLQVLRKEQLSSHLLEDWAMLLIRKNPFLIGQEVRVKVKDGTLRLNGHVSNAFQLYVLEEALQYLPSIQELDNRIKVDSSSAYIGEFLVCTVEGCKPFVGQKTHISLHMNPAKAPADAQIELAMMENLRYANVPPELNVKFVSKNGTLTIEGKVPNHSQKRIILQNAIYSGAVKIVDRLEIAAL